MSLLPKYPRGQLKYPHLVHTPFIENKRWQQKKKKERKSDENSCAHHATIKVSVNRVWFPQNNRIAVLEGVSNRVPILWVTKK